MPLYFNHHHRQHNPHPAKKWGETDDKKSKTKTIYIQKTNKPEHHEHTLLQQQMKKSISVIKYRMCPSCSADSYLKSNGIF